MAITPRSSPDIITQAAMAETVAARPAAALEAFDIGGGTQAAVTASAPLPVYTIPVAALAEERLSSLGDASQNGWRVLTTDSRGSQLVDVSAVTGSPLMVRRGQSVGMLTAAGSIAEGEVPEGAAYEPRIIDFGRLGLSALWLHGPAGRDVLVRLDREPAVVSTAAFLAEATRRARRRTANGPGDAVAEPDVPHDVGG